MRTTFKTILLIAVITPSGNAAIFEFAPSVGYDTKPGSVSYGGALDFNLARFIISLRGNYLEPESDYKEQWKYEHFNAGASIGYIFGKFDTEKAAVICGFDYFGSRKEVGGGVDVEGYFEEVNYLRLTYRFLFTVGLRIDNLGFNGGPCLSLLNGAGITNVSQRGSYFRVTGSHPGNWWSYSESLAGKDLTLDLLAGYELKQKIAGFLGVTSTGEINLKLNKDDEGPLEDLPAVEFRIYLGPSFSF